MNIKQLRELLEKAETEGLPEDTLILQSGYDHSYVAVNMSIGTAMQVEGEWSEDHGDFDMYGGEAIRYNVLLINE